MKGWTEIAVVRKQGEVLIIAKEHSLGREVKMTKRRLGIGWAYRVWRRAKQ